MIYSFKNLANTLREHCDSAKNRIWICSPFIGSEKDILRIIGGSWKKNEIDFRVITDIETGFIRHDTYNEFINNHPNSIRSLKALHAKIYIIDDWCLISSANLTGTAFSKRYEIGTDDVDVKEVETFFDSLWKSKDTKSVTSWRTGKKHSQSEFEDGEVGYKQLTKLPPYSAEMEKMDKYLAQCSRYIAFAKTYEKITGRCKDMVNDGFTLLQEVDYLFNYLEHVAYVSQKLTKVRQRTESSRNSLIDKYFEKMSANYTQNRNHELRRIKSTKLVQKLTSPSKIKTIKEEDVRRVLDTFNCFGLGSDMHGHASNFIKENSLEDIKFHWDALLNHGDITAEKVKECRKLRHCGDSSVSELIAWRFPDKYPIMNTCSKKGLWFFGID